MEDAATSRTLLLVAVAGAVAASAAAVLAALPAPVLAYSLLALACAVTAASLLAARIRQRGLFSLLAADTQRSLAETSLLEWLRDDSMASNMAPYLPFMLSLNNSEVELYLRAAPPAVRAKLMQPGLGRLLPAGLQRLVFGDAGPEQALCALHGVAPCQLPLPLHPSAVGGGKLVPSSASSPQGMPDASTALRHSRMESTPLRTLVSFPTMASMSPLASLLGLVTTTPTAPLLPPPASILTDGVRDTRIVVPPPLTGGVSPELLDLAATSPALAAAASASIQVPPEWPSAFMRDIIRRRMARMTSRSLDGVGLTRERLADITLSSALLALITVTASSRRACPAQSQRMCVWLRRAAMLAAGVSASAATVWWLRKRSASLMDECVPLDANALEEAASQAGDDADPRDCATDSLVDQLLAKHTISSRVDAALGALDSERRAPSGSSVAIDAVNCATNVMALPNPHKLADVLAHLSSAASPHLARMGLNAPSAARASQRSLPRTAAAALTAARRESVVRHLQYDEAPAPAFGTGPHAGTGRPESSNPLSLLSTLLARARRLAASPAAQQFVQWVTHIWRAVQTWQAAHPGASSASVSVITLLIILWAARRAPTSRSR